MQRYIIIRGPAASGKTVIAKKIASKLGAYYLSFDDLMEKNHLDTIVGDGIPANNFIKANEIAISIVKDKKRVIFDGCFYRKRQIDDLCAKLPAKHDIFTLNASVAECIKRNKCRKTGMSDKDVRQVHRLVSKLIIGHQIDTDRKTKDEIESEIIGHLRNL